MDALIKFYTNDWYFAIPMTLMLIIALALVIWRLMLNQGAAGNMDLFLPDLQTNLRKKGLKAAVALCETEKGIVPQKLYTAGLQAADQGVAAMRRSMASAVELEIIPRLNYLLPASLAIAKISTMVGLLGTVISMIGTFSAIGEGPKGGGGGGNMSAQSEKIGLALFATAMGLVTAIPLVFCHVLFRAWIAKFEIKMKLAAQNLVALVQNVKNNPDAGDEEEAAIEVDEDEDDEEGDRRSAKRTRRTGSR